MKEPAIFRRIGEGIVPVTETARKMVNKAEIEGLLEFKVASPQSRSLAFQRRYWAILTKCEMATGFDKEVLHEWLLLKRGYAEAVTYPGGEVRTRAKSTAFDEMEQEEFQKYVQGAELELSEQFDIDPAEFTHS